MWLLKVRVGYPEPFTVLLTETHNTFWLNELVGKLLECDYVIEIEVKKQAEKEEKGGKRDG